MGPELDLRPQLERLDRLICWSEDIDEGALSFAFRPLWQLDEPARAALALSRAQATQVYAGLKLWPDAMLAKLAEAQLVADGTYPNAAVFAEQAGEAVTDAREVGAVPRANGGFWPKGEEPRDWHGRWTIAGGGAPSRDPPLVRVAQNDPIAGGNPDIDQKIDEEQKQQAHSSELFHHPNSEGPTEILRAALQPLGTAGAGGKIQLPSAAGVVAKPNAPLVLATPKIAGVPPASGMQSSSGRSAIQAGPNSLPYFPEFENNSIYKFFRDRFTAPLERLAALKSQMPDDIARHMIDGFIGPGPFAQEPIELSPVGKITDEMIGYNDLIGYGFGCYQCGTRNPGAQDGSFIIDHELPQALNFGDWTYRFYPHCQMCSSKQGGHVRVLKFWLRREGLIP